MLLQAVQRHKTTTISLKIVEYIVAILTVAQLVRTVIFSQLDISHVLNETTPEIQHRK